MSGEEPQLKRTCVKIGTHNGSFHCDEVLACVMLRELKQFKNAEVIRSRDPNVLATCDIVVDVGGVYDPAKNRFDHHQRSFKESMNSLNPSWKYITKLSSAGLIYHHFGLEVVATVINLPVDDPTSALIHEKVYENFVEEIDGIDNGINLTEDEPKYRITTSISSRVGQLNPAWNERDMDEHVQFEKAMMMVRTEFVQKVYSYLKTWMPAREIVVEAMKNRLEVDPSGQIVSLSAGGCPWKEHIFLLEKEMNLTAPILYVLYTDSNSHWRVQCVPVHLSSFQNRLSLKEEWRGVRDEELSDKSGIPGCIFVHASGFIGGNKTYEGALEMARQSMAAQQK